ncbi:MAG: penicillin acylase family protein [Pseudomonadota bacterium]
MSKHTHPLPFKRILITSTISLLVLLMAVWFGGRWYLADSVMPMSGVHAVSGLSAPVEVLFDARGIPRIYGQRNADVIQALGWLHAGERLFQMELMRKVARGEISEIIGPVGLDSDILHRQFGFARRIDQQPPRIDPTVQQLLDAYVRGINDYLDQHPLPPSFRLLNHTPDRWSADDVLTLAYYQTWYPLTLVQRLSEVWRSVADLQGDAGSSWLITLPNWGHPSVPNMRMTEASNTWVVGPERSSSGHALHASDPHLDYTMAPGLWYAAGLHAEEGLNVVGVTPPGLPFVAMGHNGQIAFAFTVAPVDLYEWYRLPTESDQPDTVIGPDGPTALLSRVERFFIRGEDEPVEQTLYSTAQGLVMERSDEAVEVMHWAGFELPIAGLISQGLAINQSQNFDQFRAAASDMGALSVNWSYSDRDGNIGYVQSTPIPKRAHQQFYQTLDGTDPEKYWQGLIAPARRPFSLNPSQGWLANSNNHAALEVIDADGQVWPIPGFYKHLRMRRAVDWLQQDRRFTSEEMRSMQLDQRSERALGWKGLLADSAEQSGRSALAEELREWDGTMAVESDLAGLFARWWAFLPQHLFQDGPLENIETGRILLDDWIHQSPANFELNPVSLERAAARALDDALKLGLRPLGSIQDLTIAHPLASASVLDTWLNLTRGPIPIGGDPGGLNVTYQRWNADQARFSAAAGASMRYVMDWADPNGFTLNLTMGQSGHPLSPHFDDFLSDFLSGTPWPVPFDRDRVIEQSVSQLQLIPQQ